MADARRIQRKRTKRIQLICISVLVNAALFWDRSRKNEVRAKAHKLLI